MVSEFITDPQQANELAEALTRKEVKDGIQTLQYQINTLSCWGAL